MTPAAPDPTLFVVARDRLEEPPFRAGAQRLCDWITRARGRRFAMTLRFGSADAALGEMPGAAPGAPHVVIVSLLGEALAADEPFDDTRARLHRTLAALCGRPGVPVLVCTVFRHVDATAGARDDPPRTRRLERIRRLDLLAAELSHAHGASVVDIDRMLADAGGRRLGCDWRLASTDGVDAAGCVIASAMLASALDDALEPSELQRVQALHGGGTRLRQRIERIVAARASREAARAGA